MHEDRLRELEHRVRELEREVEDLIGVTRANEHAVAVLVTYVARNIEGLDQSEFLRQVRQFKRWPRRTLVKEGKKRALGRLPMLLRACSKSVSAEP